MDHFHTLDAYRSNKKLVPLNTEQVPEEDLRKAVALTIEKRELLESQVNAHGRSHVIVQVMICFTALLFVVSSWHTDFPTGIKIAYTVIICAAFLLVGVFAYVLFFENQIYRAKKTLRTFDELYLFVVPSVRNIYNLQRDIRDANKDSENDYIPCTGESGVSGSGGASEEGLKGSKECENANEVLRNAIQHGVIYTFRGDAGKLIDESVESLRKMLGAETYRTIGEEDAYDIIDDIVVPMMIESQNDVGVSKNGYPVSESGEVCDAFCSETVKRLKEDVLSGKKAPTLSLLDEAWQKCHPQMSEVCSTDALKTGENRCAFGCAKAEKKQGVMTTVAVKNKKPDPGTWEVYVKDTPKADEDGAEAPAVAQSSPSETECFKHAADTENVDAAYYGQSQDGGASACHLHYEQKAKGTFANGTGNFSGKLLFKERHNVDVPEGTPAAVAAHIAMRVKETNTQFDISDYDVYLYDQLRAHDHSFSTRKAFYEKTFLLLAEMLKPDPESEQDYLIPSIKRTNEELAAMNTRQFQSRIVWPLAKASVFLHIKAVRLDLQENYAPETKQVRLRSRYNMIMFGLIVGVVMSVAGYLAFAAEMAGSKTQEGSLTIRSFIVDRWQQHVIVLSVLVMFWTIARSMLLRDHARRVFNEKMKLVNTETLITKTIELRDFLFSYTNTLEDLAADDNTSSKRAPRERLMKAVHTERMDVLNNFPTEEAMMIDVFTLETKLKFVRLAEEVVKAYDRCNAVGSSKQVPFPTPEVLMYSAAIVILSLILSFMYSTFDITNVAKRVERVRSLRPKLYLGDAAAAREISGLLQCAESSARNQFELTKSVFIGAIGVVGIMITTVLVSGDNEYKLALDSGFMLSRGKCLA